MTETTTATLPWDEEREARFSFLESRWLYLFWFGISVFVAVPSLLWGGSTVSWYCAGITHGVAALGTFRLFIHRRFTKEHWRDMRAVNDRWEQMKEMMTQ